MNSKSSLFAAVALAVLATGCGGEPAPEKPPLAGARIGGPFALIGTDSQTVRDTDFAGKYRLVYFGYAFCPDVCPNDLQKLGVAMRQIERSDPALAARIVPIFITVDPERDTPAVVKNFVSAFHPRLVGLTGSAEAIAAAAKSYAVAYRKQPPVEGGAYLVDHAAIAYLMGPSGEPIAFFSQDVTADAIAAELRRWVK